MTSEQRSRTMRAVRSRDTGPEIAVRKLAHRLGYRYRLHGSHLPGKPDMVFPGRRKAIFINGCFWHGHDCPRGARVPKTNTAYWTAKIARNGVRDAASIAQLKANGWRTLVLWECELREADALAKRLKDFLGS